MLVFGTIGLISDLSDTDAFTQGYGVMRGAMLLDLGKVAVLLWLARTLRYTSKHGGTLRAPTPTQAS